MLNKKLTTSMTNEKNRLLNKKKQHILAIEQIDMDVQRLDSLLGQLPAPTADAPEPATAE